MQRPAVDRREWTAVAALVVAALVLRLWKLDAPLWYDEIMTLVHFVRQPFSQLIADYSSFNNHPLYSLQAKLAVGLFGEQAWALRLPSMLFGVASVWALWRLARTALGPAEALLAAALLALSYHHIWFSQNARGYTELMFWCLAALLLFVQGLGSRSWKLWAAFGAILAAAMYTHVTAAFFVAALGLVYAAMLLLRLALPGKAPEAWQAPADRGAQIAPLLGFVFGGALTLILCAPSAAQMLGHVAQVKATSEVDVMQEYQNPLWTALEAVRSLSGSNPLMLAAAPAAMILAAVGAVSLLRRQPVIAAVGLLHLPLTMLVLLALSMRLWPRFFFTDLAFVLLFIVHGAWVLAGVFGRLAGRIGLPAATPGRLFALAAAAMLVASAGLAVRNYALPKQNFPGAVELLAQEGAVPASVGALGLAAEPYNLYLRTGWTPIQTVGDLQRLSPANGRRWVVLVFPTRTSRRYAEVMQVLEQDYELVRRFPGTLGDGGVWVFGSRTVS